METGGEQSRESEDPMVAGQPMLGKMGWTSLLDNNSQRLRCGRSGTGASIGFPKVCYLDFVVSCERLQAKL